MGLFALVLSLSGRPNMYLTNPYRRLGAFGLLLLVAFGIGVQIEFWFWFDPVETGFKPMGSVRLESILVKLVSKLGWIVDVRNLKHA